MTHIREWPIWEIAPWGADFVVPSFTDGPTVPFISLTWNDRSRIARNCLDLWGIIARGEIVSSGGGFDFKSSHFTIRACPSLTFSWNFMWTCLIASGSRADSCGPQSIGACICSCDHFRLVLVGQPRVANSLSKSAAGGTPAGGGVEAKRSHLCVLPTT